MLVSSRLAATSRSTAATARASSRRVTSERPTVELYRGHEGPQRAARLAVYVRCTHCLHQTYADPRAPAVRQTAAARGVLPARRAGPRGGPRRAGGIHPP